MANSGLLYIGEGKWIPGVPARDLSPDEVQRFSAKALLSTGLYIEIPKVEKKGPTADKRAEAPSENKEK